MGRIGVKEKRKTTFISKANDDNKKPTNKTVSYSYRNKNGKLVVVRYTRKS